MQRQEVPTHLNIEDKAFAGLTMRQLMVAIIDALHLPTRPRARRCCCLPYGSALAAPSCWSPRRMSVLAAGGQVDRGLGLRPSSAMSALPRVVVPASGLHTAPRPSMRPGHKYFEFRHGRASDDKERYARKRPGDAAAGGDHQQRALPLGGDYRAVIQAQSVNFALKSEEEQEAVMAAYRSFLNSSAIQSRCLCGSSPPNRPLSQGLPHQRHQSRHQ